MATFVKHTSCPKCKSRDNLAIYSDSGAFCFGCGYTVRASVSGFVRDRDKGPSSSEDYQQQEEPEEKTWTIPDDLSQDFPEEVVKLIQKYSLTIEELIKYGYYFSRRAGRLWRILDSKSDRQLRSFMGRSYDSAEAYSCVRAAKVIARSNIRASPKSIFYGSKEGTSALAGTEHQSEHLVIVEDGFSSLKIGRVTHSLPLFGTSISTNKITALKGYKQVTVWLDHDKFKEAWAIANKFKWLGCETNVVLTEHDPKYYTESEIMYYLGITNANSS